MLDVVQASQNHPLAYQSITSSIFLPTHIPLSNINLTRRNKLASPRGSGEKTLLWDKTCVLRTPVGTVQFHRHLENLNDDESQCDEERSGDDEKSSGDKKQNDDKK
jgi:hypothetical protein